MRYLGLDTHRDFREVAISEQGRARSVGRIDTTDEALEPFASSLAPTTASLGPMTEPHVRDLPARTYVGERSTVARDEFAATIDAGFPRLFARAGEPLGPPFIRYHAFEPELDIELGVPSASGEAELPAGKYLMVTHVGAYEQLVAVHASLRAWAAEHDLALGDAIEIYLTNPRAEADVSKWKTEVGYRLTRDH